MTPLIDSGGSTGFRADPLSDLMQFRVRDVLLVASEYDAFILEGEQAFTQHVRHEPAGLDPGLDQDPRFTAAQTGEEGLRRLATKSFDLVVTTTRLADMPVVEFGRQVRSRFPDLPIGVLAAHAWETPLLEGLRDSGAVDWVILWLGNVESLLAMIQQQEDRRNADHDVLVGGVQVVILVEQDVRFLSLYLPQLYAEITRQTARLMSESLNLSHRLVRMRARPKVLLARTPEEAWLLYERYAENVLGVLSEVRVPAQGRAATLAGIELTRRIRERDAELPVLLQSSDADDLAVCASAGASYVHKDSPMLLEEMRRFMIENFGFGDFVFRLPDQAEIGRAADLRQLVSLLERVPDASIELHARRNHFSRWFAARGEFELAALMRPRTVSEFSSISRLRAYLITMTSAYLREIRRRGVADFDPGTFDEFTVLARTGAGSLGGKGRGLAFLQRLLAQGHIEFPGVGIELPQTLIVATGVFEKFLDRNGLGTLVHDARKMTDDQIVDRFRGGRFERELRAHLASYLGAVRDPLAVRSSSILEDSPYQPFSGVYATLMLPNSHPSIDVRLAQLLEAIKIVYASMYVKAARDYFETTPHRLEEERMAVLVQRIGGRRRGDAFYPLFSGLVSSHNFFPSDEQRPDEGVVLMALGLGASIAEGVETFRLCAERSSAAGLVEADGGRIADVQGSLWALDMSRDDRIPGPDVESTLVRIDAAKALDGDTADADLCRALCVPGSPLPAALRGLLHLVKRGMGCPVEIEFAVDASRSAGDALTLHLLQVRPLVIHREEEAPAVEERFRRGAIVYSQRAHGPGRALKMWDIVVVSAQLDRGRTQEAASALERFEQDLRREGRPYVLIGPGRWGTSDSSRGIPVRWSQISSARAIVETDFADLEVEASQGTSFFRNLVSAGVAFFPVHARPKDGEINWSWIEAQPAAREELGGLVRHIRLEKPVEVLVSGSGEPGAIVLQVSHGVRPA